MAQFTKIPNGYKADNNTPLDGRTHYNTIAEALADNPVIQRPSPPYPTPTETNRFIGQKMVIVNPPGGGSPCEYWFKNGITDGDLVKYTPDDKYKWEKINAFGGGSGGSGGGVSIGTVSFANGSYLTNVDIKSKVLGFANDSHKLVYFTINAATGNNSLSGTAAVGTLSVAPAADTAISVYNCETSTAAKGKITSDGKIYIYASKDGSASIVISGCFVTGAT